MSIMSRPDKKMLLGDIYKFLCAHYPWFRKRDVNWRNSIRHNLSLNECFVKCPRSDGGKGHLWTIHTVNVEDFLRGDFRRGRAQRKVRRYKGLPVTHNPFDDRDDLPPRWPIPEHFKRAVELHYKIIEAKEKARSLNLQPLIQLDDNTDEDPSQELTHN